MFEQRGPQRWPRICRGCHSFSRPACGPPPGAGCSLPLVFVWVPRESRATDPHPGSVAQPRHPCWLGDSCLSMIPCPMITEKPGSPGFCVFAPSLFKPSAGLLGQARGHTQVGRDPEGQTCCLSLCSCLCPAHEGTQYFSDHYFDIMQDGTRTESYFHLSVLSVWLEFLVFLLWVIDTVGINISKEGGGGCWQSRSEEFVPCTFQIVVASIAEPSPALPGLHPRPAVLLLSISSIPAHWALASLGSSPLSDGAGTWTQAGLQGALPETPCHLLRANHPGGAREPRPGT